MPDDTALGRQHKRLAHLKERGLKRTTLLVHSSNEAILELLRAHFSNPESAEALKELHPIISSRLSANNISKVRQLSPFRYAGGKTWLVPEVRRWIESLAFKPSVFLEPFAGGATVGLTVAVENLAEKVVLCELDKDVAAVWKIIFGRRNEDADWLCTQILQAQLTEGFVRDVIESEPLGTKERAFRTIIKNRTQRGGILAPGAGLIKAGENGKGLLSRWYPETLVKRIATLREVKQRVKFVEGDAFELIAEYSNQPKAAFFVDPPYTAGGKKAGARLYLHNLVDHDKLFSEIAKVQGEFLLTYDNAQEVIDLASSHGMAISKIPMKNTHHEIIYELLIKKNVIK